MKAIRTICLAIALAVTLTGCGVLQSWFAPQKEAAALCADLLDQNSAITCIDFVNGSIRDTANEIARRKGQGAIDPQLADELADRLDEMLDMTALASTLVGQGDLASAEGQMGAVIAALDQLERRLQ